MNPQIGTGKPTLVINIYSAYYCNRNTPKNELITFYFLQEFDLFNYMQRSQVGTSVRDGFILASTIVWPTIFRLVPWYSFFPLSTDYIPAECHSINSPVVTSSWWYRGRNLRSWEEPRIFLCCCQKKNVLCVLEVEGKMASLSSIDASSTMYQPARFLDYVYLSLANQPSANDPVSCDLFIIFLPHFSISECLEKSALWSLPWPHEAWTLDPESSGSSYFCLFIINLHFFSKLCWIFVFVCFWVLIFFYFWKYDILFTETLPFTQWQCSWKQMMLYLYFKVPSMKNCLFSITSDGNYNLLGCLVDFVTFSWVSTHLLQSLLRQLEPFFQFRMRQLELLFSSNFVCELLRKMKLLDKI